MQADRTKVGSDIFPLFIVRKTTPVDVVSFQGTAFLIAPSLLTTCWHCVSSQLAEDQAYAVAVEGEAPGAYRALFLSNVSRDDNGTDLATANIDLQPTLGLSLQPYDFPYGTST